MSPPRTRRIGETIAIGLACVLSVLFFSMRTFVVQQFSTPSGSMEPTLLVGDDFLVAKFAYGYPRANRPPAALSRSRGPHGQLAGRSPRRME